MQSQICSPQTVTFIIKSKRVVIPSTGAELHLSSTELQDPSLGRIDAGREHVMVSLWSMQIPI